MISRERFIDLLAMSRFANLPTVWSNGLLGALLGWIFFGSRLGPACPLCLLAIGLSLSCLYLGGCFLNDVHDADFDRKTRPDRAIPAGRWAPRTILYLSIALMSLGLILALIVSAASGLFAAGIVICILAYTKWHKRTAWSFIFMAGARALIYPTAAYSFLSWNQFLLVGSQITPLLVALTLGLGGYILGISLTAKSESSGTPPTAREQAIPVACLCAPIIFIASPALLSRSGPTAAALALFFIVLVFSVRSVRSNHKVGLFVSRTLAAIPLVDGLLVTANAPHAIFWFICPALSLMALGLQKIAPAT